MVVSTSCKQSSKYSKYFLSLQANEINYQTESANTKVNHKQMQNKLSLATHQRRPSSPERAAATGVTYSSPLLPEYVRSAPPFLIVLQGGTLHFHLNAGAKWFVFKVKPNKETRLHKGFHIA